MSCKIITATGNETIDEKLKENKVDVLCNDIQYKEGVLEYLEKNNELDYVILNKKIPGEISLENLIEKIKEINENIKIILISDKEEKNIYKRINELDINLISNMILGNDNYCKVTTANKGKVILITGPNGIGKSIFSVKLAQSLKKSRVAVIDMDIANNTLHLLLGASQYENNVKYNMINNIDNKVKIEDLVISTKIGVDLFSGLNLMYTNTLKENIDKITEKYDYILIDTESNSENTKRVYKFSQYIILLTGANKLEIRKSQRLINLIKENNDLKNKKIFIVINKYSKNSLDKYIIKNIFNKEKVISTIEYSTEFDLEINTKISGNKRIKDNMEEIKRKMRL